jgi:hypothetical protein
MNSKNVYVEFYTKVHGDGATTTTALVGYKCCHKNGWYNRIPFGFGDFQRGP